MQKKPSSFPTSIVLIVLLGFVCFHLGWVDVVMQWFAPAEPVAQVSSKVTTSQYTQTLNDKAMQLVVSRTTEPEQKTPLNKPVIESQCHMNWHSDEAVADAKERLSLLDDNLEFEKSQFRLSNYAVVNLITPKLADDYHQTLKKRLRRAYSSYRAFFQVSSKQAYTVNLVVLPPRYYDDYISLFGEIPATNIGMYFGASNTAFVKYKHSNPEQSLKTAVHEALHVFNYRLIGHMPKWLNEGLAEVFENILNYNSPKEVNLPSRYFQERLFMLSVLSESEESWYGADTLLMYKNSAVWVGFLMQSTRGKRVLRALLQHEAKNACDVLTTEQVIHTLIDYYPRYEEDFNSWIKKWSTTQSKFVPII